MPSTSPRPPFLRSSPSSSDIFRIGDASLTLYGDSALRDRFRVILGDCASPSALPVNLDCSVSGDGTLVFAYDGDRLDLRQVLESVTASGDHPPVPARVEGDTLSFDPTGEWRGLAANTAINLTFAMQPGVFFFHAASVAIRGRGVMLAGSKCAGKSTLSMALAADGNTLLGDEMAAVRVATNELLPLPRAASVREGLRSEAVDARLGEVPTVEERYPDGSRRLRIRISDLFPSAEPAPVPLAAIVFLRSFAPEVRAERFTPGFADSTLLQPLGAAWQSGASRFRLLRLLSSVPCFHLDAASPEATAAFIERLLEESCP